MKLRNIFQNKQGLADKMPLEGVGFSCVEMWSSMTTAARSLLLPPLHHTLSADGQRACPLDLLSVIFSVSRKIIGQVVEQFMLSCVVTVNVTIKGKLSWLSIKSVSHLLSLLGFRLVATTSVNRHWAAVRSALVLRPSQVGACSQGLQSVPVPTWLPAKPRLSTVSNATILPSVTRLLRRPLARGVFCVSTFFSLPHKGPVYVQ